MIGVRALRAKGGGGLRRGMGGTADFTVVGQDVPVGDRDHVGSGDVVEVFVAESERGSVQTTMYFSAGVAHEIADGLLDMAAALGEDVAESRTLSQRLHERV